MGTIIKKMERLDKDLLLDKVRRSITPVMPSSSKKSADGNKTCPVHGPYSGISDDCPACREERKKIADNKRSSDIPGRYTNADMAQFHIYNKKQTDVICRVNNYVECFPDRLRTGTGILFCGTVGTGKTFMACAVANELLKRGYKARYINFFGFIQKIKMSFGDKSKSESEIIKPLISADLLVIDEIGVQFGSELERIYLYHIVNARYEMGNKPTILVTNLSIQKLSDFVDSRSIDRMMEAGGLMLLCEWQSYRQFVG